MQMNIDYRSPSPQRSCYALSAFKQITICDAGGVATWDFLTFPLRPHCCLHLKMIWPSDALCAGKM